jgi:sugar-specific transcriptional regulator TrmB
LVFNLYTEYDKMSNERINEALKKFGLSSIDVQVYVFLADQGSKEIKEIALALDLPEKKVHRSLKDLQSISVVEASIEYPLEFMALPFERVLDLLIKIKKEQAKTLKATREELLVTWKSITEKDEEKS